MLAVRLVPPRLVIISPMHDIPGAIRTIGSRRAQSSFGPSQLELKGGAQIGIQAIDF